MSGNGASSDSARLLAPLSAAAELADGAAYCLYPLSSLDALAAAGVPRKVVHLIRHAQGSHNAAVSASGDEAEYCNEAWADARLTELGRSQAAALVPVLSDLRLDAVLTSCLSRTIETASGALPAGPARPPFFALDVLRERIGTHPCDRRRARAALRADYPHVDLSDLASEEDDKWSPAREPWEGVVARAEAFCAAARARKEEHLAVCTHNDFLVALLQMSRVALADDVLKVTFTNAQHLPVVLTWRPPAGGANN